MNAAQTRNNKEVIIWQEKYHSINVIYVEI